MLCKLYNNDQMSNIDKIRATFNKQGYKQSSRFRRPEFENFLNSLVSGELYSPEVAAEIWEQASEGQNQVSVENLCSTIVQAQNIVQNKLFELSDHIKSLQEEAKTFSDSRNSQRYNQLVRQLQEKEEEKRSFEDDLVLLTEPFGINMLAFMANAARVKKAASQPYEFTDSQAEEATPGGEVELKWLFYLCVGIAVIEVIVIYKKYDFLNLMVLACLMLIFFMNQFDSTYLKFTLGLLIVSEVLDTIWLFMNSNDYWNPPEKGVNSSAEKGYLRLIVFLTFLALFLKIPLGVFLYHYRNIDQSKTYQLDLGFAKMNLTPNKVNPISEGIKRMEILN